MRGRNDLLPEIRIRGARNWNEAQRALACARDFVDHRVAQRRTYNTIAPSITVTRVGMAILAEVRAVVAVPLEAEAHDALWTESEPPAVKMRGRKETT